MPGATTTTNAATLSRVAELEVALAAERAENQRLRAAYQQLRLELELLKRRLFVAKAERIDTRELELELELGHKLAALDALNQRLGLGAASDTADADTADADAADADDDGAPRGTGVPPGRDRGGRDLGAQPPARPPQRAQRRRGRQEPALDDREPRPRQEGGGAGEQVRQLPGQEHALAALRPRARRRPADRDRRDRGRVPLPGRSARSASPDRCTGRPRRSNRLSLRSWRSRRSCPRS